MGVVLSSGVEVGQIPTMIQACFYFSKVTGSAAKAAQSQEIGPDVETTSRTSKIKPKNASRKVFFLDGAMDVYERKLTMTVYS